MADSSFVYMLKVVKDIEVSALSDYLGRAYVFNPNQGTDLQSLIEEETYSAGSDYLNIGQGLKAFGDHVDSKAYLDFFRIQISLGSSISSIEHLDENGFVVNYEGGDECSALDASKRYSSSIEFICDASD